MRWIVVFAGQLDELSSRARVLYVSHNASTGHAGKTASLDGPAARLVDSALICASAGLVHGSYRLRAQDAEA